MSNREAEFREFVGARMESLRGLAYLTCGDWQVAEDAVLSAMARLYGRWQRVENHEAYARTAVVRAAIDEMRRPWWRREQSYHHADLPVRTEPDGTGVVDERIRVRAALAQLPPKMRAVLVLRYLEGLSVRETATALRCPEGTVKAHTSRGLDSLRRILGTDFGIDDRWEGRHEAAV